ncbi:MAG: pitrilysin family protein [Candidatus Krumholzibacteria bacterium]|nr:pitrilysin family protein [Candidatus Krumholzibacteria bacterium]
MKRIVALMILAAALAGPAAAGGMKDVTMPPAAERTLDNGLKVFVVETREVPLVTLRLLVPAGSVFDPAGREGAANLTAGLLLKGAGGLGAEEISAAIEGVGGRLEAYAGKEYTIVAGEFLSRNLALGLAHLARAVTAPDFPEDELARERSIVLARLQQVKENPGALASREFTRRLLAGHPYGNPVEGYPGSVGDLARADVVSFHGTHYVPKGSILAVVGDVDAKKVMTLVGKELGGWTGEAPAAKVPDLPAARVQGRRVIVIDKPDMTQTQIRIGNLAGGMNAPDYFAAEVANTLLGGGFTSRLMDEIRVNRGLTYGVRSGISRYRGGGYFAVGTFTKHATARECIDVALAEVERIRTEPVGDDELAGTGRYIAGLFPFEIETNGDLARWLTEVEFYGLGREFVETYRTRVGAVGAGDLREAAAGNFRSGGNMILVLTNYEATADQLKDLGELEVIPIGDIE